MSLAISVLCINRVLASWDEYQVESFYIHLMGLQIMVMKAEL